ncbi:MAG: hypothetical protein ACK4M3_05865 [Pyrobaculum sp.]
MNLAYVRGPPVATFAGSWRCVKSPIDGTPVALGEPLGDCDADIARLMSIATTVRLVKTLGVKVFVSAELGGEGIDAAYAGGADGVFEELATSHGDYREGARYVLFEVSTVGELANTARKVAESAGRPFDILAATDFEKAPLFAPHVDALFLKGGWIHIEVAETRLLPEIGRCIHCGVDYLMYGSQIRRCIYCGRKLTRVITETRPPRSRAVFRSVYRKYLGINKLRLKIV